MKKEEKFILDLKKGLSDFDNNSAEIIISKYKNLIKEERKNKKRITDIINSFGSIEDIVNKEKNSIKTKKSNDKKKNLKVRKKDKVKVKKDYEKKEKNIEVKNKVNSFVNKIKRIFINKKEKKKNKDNINSDRKINFDLKNKVNEVFKKIKSSNLFNKKEKTGKLKKVKKGKNTLKDKKIINTDFKSNIFTKIWIKTKKIFIIIKNFIVDIISKIKIFFSKMKKKNKNKDIVSVIDDVSGEILEDVSEITEKKVLETKRQRIFRIIKTVSGILFIIICIFILLWSIVVLMATVFSLLDGLKIYGIVITIFGLVLFLIWFITLIYSIIFKLKVHKKLTLVFMFLIIFIIGGGIAYTIRQYERVENVHDVSDKYEITTFTDRYELPTRNRTLYISFNSLYNTDYILEYDNTLDDTVKVQVQYYENYYDFYVKKSNTNLYLSLKEDPKDRISALIDDLKDSKIYDTDEFKRYILKIFINEKYKDRIVIMK